MSLVVQYQEEGSGPVYTRCTWYAGGSWESYERNVVPGTVRLVNGLLIRAWTVEHRLIRKPRIFWIPVDPTALRKVEVNERP